MGRRTRKYARISLLAAIGAITMFFELPLPFLPEFLKLDLSEIPVLVGTFAMGPVAGVLIELIKNLIHLTATRTVGIGELANFFIGCAMVIPAGIIYRWRPGFGMAAIGLAAGSIVMIWTAACLNYYILVPLYQAVLKFPLETMILMSQKSNGSIVDLKTFIVYAIVPFNIIKAMVVSGIMLLLYRRMQWAFHQ